MTAISQRIQSVVVLARELRAEAGPGALGAIGIIYLHQVLDSADGQGLNVLLPDIRRDFDLSLAGVTTLGTLVAVASLLLGLPLAGAVDRFGKRILWLAGGAALAAAASLGVGVAPGIAWFVVARIALGLGLKANDPVQNSLLADYTPVASRSAVYSGRAMAKSVGQAIGPIAFGVLGGLFGWRAAFIGGAIAGLAIALVSLRLKDPVRGIQERRAMGIEDDAAEAEEARPSFAEAMSMLQGVASLRRVWWSLPFLVGGVFAIGQLQALLLEEVFGLGATARGFVAAVDEPFAFLGLIAGVPLATRTLRSDQPSRFFRLLAVVAVISAGLLLGAAAAPTIAIHVAARCALALALALITPGFATAFSLIIPARARTVGFAVSSLWTVPGILFAPVMGSIGDAYGLRWGLAAAVPLFLVGALILSSAGSTFKGDMLRSRLASLAVLEDRAARAAGKPKLLVCRGIDVSYGQVQVLFGVDLVVEEGEMVALLGTNGAGKSTLLRAIGGTTLPSGGAVIYDGREITRMPASERAALGMVQVPGGKGTFPTLTVAENLRVAAWLLRHNQERVAEATEEVLNIFPVLRDRLQQPAGNLSGGEQQMLVLAQAFLSRPKLLMIDELSLGLAPAVVQELLDVVRAIHARGTTVVLVEQSVNVALTVCHRAVFLEKGEVRYEGSTADLLERPDVLRSVFLHGASAEAPAPVPVTTRLPVRLPEPETSDEIVLEGEGLVRTFGGITAVDGVSLQLHKGEILGLIGTNGAGKTTIFDLLSGYLPLDRGRILFDGVDVTDRSADARAVLGLGRSFQDARLFPSLTATEAIAVALERHLEVRDPLSTLLRLPIAKDEERQISERVDELIELLNLGAYRDKFIGELSTGSRRIVDIACCLAHGPSVLLLDEPSSGIAQRETEALGPLLLRVHRELGTSLLVIEHDMPLIKGIAHRLIALEAGRTICEGRPDEVLDHPSVVASYLGTDEATISRSGQLAGPRPARRPRRSRQAISAAPTSTSTKTNGTTRRDR